ncbi:MAG: glycosyltransferase family 2 protein [Muribaculaceae bacterium]|nr:glycosyltransferase family 2 protein [Muribaculaceae bacterium]MDE6321956.1 glycosyltransferase family 2 protein [Muribaculaceae bacterium]
MSTSSHHPIITIVIPVYNRPKLVIRTLDSILSQDYRPLQVIVVDNGSTDNTYAAVEQWVKNLEDNQLSVNILRANKKGASYARQQGVEMVTTPWVMHFDSDDTMRPGHISRIVKGINDHPEADILGWDVITHQLDNRHKINRFYANNPMVNHIFHASLSTQRYAVRTELLKRCGGWETDIAGWDDYVLGIKLLLHKPVLAKLGNEITVDMYSQQESVSGCTFSEKQGEWEAALDRSQQLILQFNRPELLKWIDARRAIVAGHYTSEDNPQGIKLLETTCHGKSRYHRWALTRIHSHVAHKRKGTAWLCRILLTNTQ